MQAGISTACLYPMLLEDSFSTLVGLGFRHFEVFVNTFSELQDGYLAKLNSAAAESGSTVRSVHPFTSGYESFLLFSGYRRRFEDGLEFYRYYFHACNVLGAKILVLHGWGSGKNDISEEEFIERYLRLYALGKEYGITVAQENVNRFRSDEPAFLRRMRGACGNDCAFVLDIKQAVRSGADPFEMCRAMGSRICHVHINDNDASSDCLLPGFGTMDYVRLLRLLQSFGYNGSLMIEVYRKSFGVPGELLQAKKAVETAIQKLKNETNGS